VIWEDRAGEPHDEIQPNASCTDCGVDYAKADADPTTWCDPCSDRRDAHTTAMEIRFMAKAVLRSDLAHVKEVA
jgi:hypothetical protein